MACIRNGDEQNTVQKPKGLAFSIDKIIGTQFDSRQGTSNNRSDNGGTCEKGDVDISSPTSERSFSLEGKATKPPDETCESDPSVKESDAENNRNQVESEEKHLSLAKRHHSPEDKRAIMHDPTLQSKFKQFHHQGGEFQDINMNLMSYLHPAFLLGRINQDDYRAHVLQNYYLNQNSHVSRETGYALDLYKIASSQHFNSPVPMEFKKQFQIEELKLSNADKPNIDELDNKHKFGVNDSDSPSRKLNSFRDSERTVTKDSGSPEVVEKKLPSNQTRLPGNQSRNQKQFTCPECGKIFNAHYNLTRHMPVHTGR